jgi:hypothetical protein
LTDADSYHDLSDRSYILCYISDRDAESGAIYYLFTKNEVGTFFTPYKIVGEMLINFQLKIFSPGILSNFVSPDRLVLTIKNF